MKTFLLNLMGNETFKDRLVQHFQRVLPLLSEPESSLISQLKIDRNLVEVQDGWLWSFSAGSFVQGVIPESEVSRTCNLINDKLFFYCFLPVTCCNFHVQKVDARGLPLLNSPNKDLKRRKSRNVFKR